MPYVVKARDTKWDGKRYVRGEEIKPVDENDARLLEGSLVLIGKVEKVAAPAKPVRKADTPKPPPKKPKNPKAADAAPATPAAPASSAAMTTDDAAPLVPTAHRYLNRRLRSED